LGKVEESSGGWDCGWWQSAALVSAGGGGRRQWVAVPSQNRAKQGIQSRAIRGKEGQAPASFAATAASR